MLRQRREKVNLATIGWGLLDFRPPNVRWSQLMKMIVFRFHAPLIVCLLACSRVAVAGTDVLIAPSDSGTLSICGSCSPDVTRFAGGGMLVNGYLQGVARFPTQQITSPVAHAELILSPNGPLGGPSLDIYGIASGGNLATYDDYLKGTLLGSYTIPNSVFTLGTATFDVTDFVAKQHVPFVGFDFRTASALDYFTAPQLHVTFVPEPTTTTLLLLGMLGCGWRRNR
jgi:hypothetical protein